MIVCIIRIVKKQRAGSHTRHSPQGRGYTAALYAAVRDRISAWGIAQKVAMPYQGKLPRWSLEDAKTGELIPLTHDNIFRDGIDGLLSDIRNRNARDGYVANSVDLEFDSTGRILRLDTFFYGTDEDGAAESF